MMTMKMLCIQQLLDDFPELVGDVAGLDILGITGDNTLTAKCNRSTSRYIPCRSENDASALTNLLDTDGGGVSLSRTW